MNLQSPSCSPAALPANFGINSSFPPFKAVTKIGKQFFSKCKSSHPHYPRAGPSSPWSVSAYCLNVGSGVHSGGGRGFMWAAWVSKAVGFHGACLHSALSQALGVRKELEDIHSNPALPRTLCTRNPPRGAWSHPTQHCSKELRLPPAQPLPCKKAFMWFFFCNYSATQVLVTGIIF